MDGSIDTLAYALKGARLKMPSSPIVETKAIGRGATAAVFNLCKSLWSKSAGIIFMGLSLLFLKPLHHGAAAIDGD
jgi:hypothetical protein